MVELITVFYSLHRIDQAVKMEIDLILQMIIQVLQNDIINVGSQMTNGSV